MYESDNALQAPSIDWKGAQAGRFGPGGYLGVTSVPLPGSSAPIGASPSRADEKRQQETSLQVQTSTFASCLLV